MTYRRLAVPAAFVQDVKRGDLFQNGGRVRKVIAVHADELVLSDGTRVKRQIA